MSFLCYKDSLRRVSLHKFGENIWIPFYKFIYAFLTLMFELSTTKSIAIFFKSLEVAVLQKFQGFQRFRLETKVWQTERMADWLTDGQTGTCADEQTLIIIPHFLLKVCVCVGGGGGVSEDHKQWLIP